MRWTCAIAIAVAMGASGGGAGADAATTRKRSVARPPQLRHTTRSRDPTVTPPWPAPLLDLTPRCIPCLPPALSHL